MKFVCALLIAGILPPVATAQNRRNVLETLSAALEQDKAYDDAERAGLMLALRARFADYGLQVVDTRRKDAIPVVLHVITEGSFDQAPPERMADVAFAAYQAMSRGAPAEAVEGIALYGYRKKIPGERIAVWANGYRQLVEAKVPDAVAADLVRVTMERDVSDSDFVLLKWALVDGVKEGFDAKDYATYLFGRILKGARPGRVAGEAKVVFRKARREGRRPDLPAYQGVFAPPPPPKPAAPEAPAPSREETPERAPRTAAFPALWPGLEASAKSYLGTPYVWGGTSHAGIDCSALTRNTYAENAVPLPRVSRSQWETGANVAGALREGDLIFFNTMGVGVSHVGMIVDAGAKRFIHASSSRGVSYAALDDKYYRPRYLGARRVIP